MVPRFLSAIRVNDFKIGGAALIFFAYLPGVIKESFWSDDYVALMNTSGSFAHALKDARPAGAGLFYLSFTLLGGPEYAWILRSLALLVLILVYLFVTNRIKYSNNKNIGYFSAAIAFCLPSFQMYIHWTLTWFFLWAALGGLYAFHFWASKLTSHKVFAIFLLVFALTIYPPTALFYFSAITFVNVANNSKLPKILSDIVQGLALLVIGGIASVLTAFMAMKFAGVSPNPRVSILTTSDLPEKIVWLVSRPIVVGFRPFLVDSPSAKTAFITSLPIILLLLAGIRRQSIELYESTFVRAVSLATPLIITLIPIMITSDNQIEFRLLPGYCWGIATLAIFYLLIKIQDCLHPIRISSLLKTFTFLTVPTILVIVSVATLNSHYMDLFKNPYERKTVFLNSKISSCLKVSLPTDFSILPPKIPFPSLPRLGVFSMSTDLASSWVPKPNVEALLKLRQINATVFYFESRPISLQPSKTNCIIDLEDYRKVLGK